MSQLYAASSQKTDLLLPNNNIAHAPEHAAILPGLTWSKRESEAGLSLQTPHCNYLCWTRHRWVSSLLSLNRDGFLRFPFRASFLGAPVGCASLPLVLAKQHQGAQTTKPRGGTQPTKTHLPTHSPEGGQGMSVAKLICHQVVTWQ